MRPHHCAVSTRFFPSYETEPSPSLVNAALYFQGCWLTTTVLWLLLFYQSSHSFSSVGTKKTWKKNYQQADFCWSLGITEEGLASLGALIFTSSLLLAGFALGLDLGKVTTSWTSLPVCASLCHHPSLNLVFWGSANWPYSFYRYHREGDVFYFNGLNSSFRAHEID